MRTLNECFYVCHVLVFIAHSRKMLIQNRLRLLAFFGSRPAPWNEQSFPPIRIFSLVVWRVLVDPLESSSYLALFA